jgi:prepilin peptidase CpaA
MIWLIVYLSSVLAALGMGLFAGWSDFRGLKIPNMVPVIIVAAFVPAFAAVHFSGIKLFSPLAAHAGASVLVLLITFGLFALRVFGGGDAKLLSAYALWTGFAGMQPLLFYMAGSGFFVGLATIGIRKKKPFKNPREGSWIARAQAGENRVPYGIPIVIGAIIAFAMQGYLGPHNLLSFISRGG